MILESPRQHRLPPLAKLPILSSRCNHLIKALLDTVDVSASNFEAFFEPRASVRLLFLIFPCPPSLHVPYLVFRISPRLPETEKKKNRPTSFRASVHKHIRYPRRRCTVTVLDQIVMSLLQAVACVLSDSCDALEVLHGASHYLDRMVGCL